MVYIRLKRIERKTDEVLKMFCMHEEVRGAVVTKRNSSSTGRRKREDPVNAIPPPFNEDFFLILFLLHFNVFR